MAVTEKLKKMNKKLDRKWLMLNTAIVLGFLLFMTLFAMGSGMGNVVNESAFAENVSVNGHALGGKSYDEGLKIVLQEQRDKLEELRVTVIYNGNEGVFGADELGVTTDADQVLRQAFNYNKQGSLMENYARSFDEVHLETNLVVDEQKMQGSIMEFLQQHYVGPALDSAEEPETFTYTEDQQIFAADLQEVVRQVKEAVLSEDPNPVII